MESTAKYYAINTWNATDESQCPFTAIPFVLRRTNFFINVTTTGTQRTHYDPSGLSGFLRIFTSDEYYFTPYTLYAALSEEVQGNYGVLNASVLLQSVRDIYRGQTNQMLRYLSLFLHAILPETGFLNPWHQWVCDLDSGEIFISFADASYPASENLVYVLNVYELFQSL